MYTFNFVVFKKKPRSDASEQRLLLRPGVESARSALRGPHATSRGQRRQRRRDHCRCRRPQGHTRCYYASAFQQHQHQHSASQPSSQRRRVL